MEKLPKYVKALQERRSHVQDRVSGSPNGTGERLSCRQPPSTDKVSVVLVRTELGARPSRAGSSLFSVDVIPGRSVCLQQEPTHMPRSQEKKNCGVNLEIKTSELLRQQEPMRT